MIFEVRIYSVRKKTHVITEKVLALSKKQAVSYLKSEQYRIDADREHLVNGAVISAAKLI